MRADRLLAILLLLRSKGRVTAAALAVELEVSERTIYRDVDALCAAGIPVCSETGPGGGFSLPANYRVTVNGLSETEVHALFAASTPDAVSDLGLREASRNALRKVAAALPAASRLHAEEARQWVHVDPANWTEGKADLPYLPAIQQAVWRSSALQIRYRSARGAEAEYHVHPYGLVSKAGTWYLVAAASARIRVFRVSRLRHVTVMEGTFTRPAGFDLAVYWHDWCSELTASQRKPPVILHLATPLYPATSPLLVDYVYVVPTLNEDNVIY